METIKANLSKIRVPGTADKVYKDECLYSFDSPESETGLYVCLNKFIGVGKSYLQKYSDRTNNVVFLHLKKTKQEVTDGTDAVPEKVSRLAINMEGGFNTDSNVKWEEKNTLVVLPSWEEVDISSTDLPLQANLSVAGILTAVSATRQAQINDASCSWDGEACPVSRFCDYLEQIENPPKVPPKGWKCEMCDLTTNLWLNLTDGRILCGRKFFDGSGGNNHAVDHFNNKGGGSLAVKLGTISRDGKADVFSYAEDGMVIDTHLEKHLAHFGIKMASMEKTDKSMVELEIDMNQRIGEWAVLTESGSKLVPVWGPGYTGMHNLGNTCYLNSVMQVLFTIPSFRSAYTEGNFNNADLSDPASDLVLQLSKLGHGLNSGLYSKGPENGDEATLRENGSQPGVRPLMFKQLIGRNHPEFSTNRQQDAQEYFLHLLTQIDRVHRNKSIPSPSRTLQFVVEDRTECGASGQVRYVKRTEDYLPLAIPMEAATNKAEVKAYQDKKAEVEAKGETLKADETVRSKISFPDLLGSFKSANSVEDFYSSAIKAKTTALKTTRLRTFPDYLMIQLLKFDLNDSWQQVKLDVEVDMPDTLDLSDLRGSGQQPNEVILPSDPVAEEPQVHIDTNIVAQLADMGFSMEGCRRAVYNTKSVGLEPAMAWVMDHMADPDFNSPFTVPGESSKCTADEESVAMVMSMGFSKEQAEMGLRNTDNNVERAIDWIFSHPDGEDAKPEEKEDSGTPEDITDGEPRYKLAAFISHMGSSTYAGHYVCHIKDEKNRWIIFNDNKVALSEKPPKELGYLYLYKRENL